MTLNCSISSSSCLKKKIPFFYPLQPFQQNYFVGLPWNFLSIIILMQKNNVQTKCLALEASRCSVNCRNICFSSMIGLKVEGIFTGSESHVTLCSRSMTFSPEGNNEWLQQDHMQSAQLSVSKRFVGARAAACPHCMDVQSEMALVGEWEHSRLNSLCCCYLQYWRKS